MLSSALSARFAVSGHPMPSEPSADEFQRSIAVFRSMNPPDPIDCAGPYGSFPAALDEAAIRAFRHPGETLDECDEDEGNRIPIHVAAGQLTLILLYIAKGRLQGMMQHRGWAMLYQMRPDLIGAESMEAYAKRVSIPLTQVRALVTEFKQTVAGIRPPGAT